MKQVRSYGAERLILSVDERNVPAMRLYRSLGFRVFDRRRIYLRIFGS
jgi:ribosomal protein S18 acetylase RimI-like enzyme